MSEPAPPSSDEPADAGVCPSCGAPRPEKFCSRCGEKRVDAHDYSLGHFFGHAIESFTHADGKIFRSLRLLLAHPGALTADYFAGKRQPYMHPLALFIVANTFFFLVLPVLGWNTLTTPLEGHLHDQFYSPWARWVMERHFAAGVPLPHEFMHEFDHRCELLAKTLVIVMVPMVALVVALLFRGRRFLEHLIFSLHFQAFWLLWMVASLGIANPALQWLGHHGWRPSDNALDLYLTGVGMAVWATYLFHAARRVYGGDRWTLAKSVSLALALLPIVQCYRLFLFLVTNFLLVGL